MSLPCEPEGGQALLSILSADFPAFWPALLAELRPILGEPEYESPWLEFNFTSYYDAELGSPISRKLLGFGGLAPQDSLVRFKLATNRLEQKYARPDGRRLFNLDPGIITQERLVLATGKNFTHRIYLGQGIFADLTLIYQKGAFRNLAWTFPDYADPVLQEHLLILRTMHHKKLRGQKVGDKGGKSG